MRRRRSFFIAMIGRGCKLAIYNVIIPIPSLPHSLFFINTFCQCLYFPKKTLRRNIFRCVFPIWGFVVLGALYGLTLNRPFVYDPVADGSGLFTFCINSLMCDLSGWFSLLRYCYSIEDSFEWLTILWPYASCLAASVCVEILLFTPHPIFSRFMILKTLNILVLDCRLDLCSTDLCSLPLLTLSLSSVFCFCCFSRFVLF